MHHLNLEALARLVDESPDPVEAAHLAECLVCRRELHELQQQTRSLAELPMLEPPAESWHALESQLKAEGLLRDAPRTPWYAVPALRMAAGIALFVLGGVTGAAFRTGEAPQVAVVQPAAPITAITSVPVSAPQELRDAEAAYRTALARHAEMAGAQYSANPAARLATLETIVLTTEEALRQAPADPVINGYHLAAVSQRDATLRNLTRASGEEPWF